MPEHSFPESKPPNRFHSVAQSLVGFDQKSGFSSLAEPVQEPLNRSWQSIRCNAQSEINSLLRPLMFHAEPLAPLRQRDEQALEEIFDDLQVEEILTDVCIRLKQIYPEPCWEDEPFDFLRGYV